RVCVPSAPTACACDPALTSAGMKVCLQRDGENNTCPPGAPNKRIVGSSVNATCTPSCTCASIATCAGTARFYADANCTTQVTMSTTACAASTNVGGAYSSTKWEGVVTQGCTATPSPTPQPPTLSLAAPKTICCPD